MPQPYTKPYTRTAAELLAIKHQEDAATYYARARHLAERCSSSGFWQATVRQEAIDQQWHAMRSAQQARNLLGLHRNGD